MNHSTEKQRLVWLDNLKGFTILLVVIGHIADGYMNNGIFPEYRELLASVANAVTFFHMHLFFVISGFVFWQAYCAERVTRRRAFRLQLINLTWAYFLFSALQWAFKLLFASKVNNPVTVADLLWMPVKPMPPYWYLYVLFILYLVCYSAERIRMAEEIKLAFFMGASVFSLSLPADSSFPLFRILLYSFYFYFGIYLSKKNILHRIANWKTILLCGVFAVAAAQYMFRGGTYGMLVASFFVSLFLMLVFYFAAPLWEQMPVLKCTIGALFNLCGRYCLEIYVIHCFITAGNRTFLSLFGVTNFYLHATINFIMATTLPIVGAVILKKCRLHTLVFRPAALLRRK